MKARGGIGEEKGGRKRGEDSRTEEKEWEQEWQVTIKSVCSCHSAGKKLSEWQEGRGKT